METTTFYTNQIPKSPLPQETASALQGGAWHAIFLWRYSWLGRSVGCFAKATVYGLGSMFRVEGLWFRLMGLGFGGLQLMGYERISEPTLTHSMDIVLKVFGGRQLKMRRIGSPPKQQGPTNNTDS